MQTVIQKLLGIEHGNIAEGSQWRLWFLSSWPAWLTVIVLGAVITLVFMLYRKEVGHAGRAFRAFLATLRCAAVLLLLLIIFEPILDLEKVEIRKSYVAVLVDNSLSMSIKDKYENGQSISTILRSLGVEDQLAEGGTPSRMNLVRLALSSEKLSLLKRLEESHRIKIYTFSSRVHPGPGGIALPELESLGRVSRIGSCLRESINDLKGQTVAGIVLLTDGQWNSDHEAPLDTARFAALKGIPIYPVGVGSPERPSDIEVIDLIGNDVVFVGDSISFVASVRSEGFSGKSVNVELRRDGEIVGTRELLLAADRGKQEVELDYKAEQPGKYVFSATIQAEEGELFEDNNSSLQIVDVVEKKIRVLLVAGRPTWEYRYLKNALLRDRTVELASLLQSSDSSYFHEGEIVIERYPSSEELLSEYDAIVFMEPNPALFTNGDLENTANFVEKRGGGFLLAAGAGYDPSGFVGTPVATMSPVVIPPGHGELTFGRKEAYTHAYRIERTAEGKENPILRLDNDEQKNEEIWQNLPGLFWYYPTTKAKAGASVLAVHPFRRNEFGKLPLIAAQFYGAGRTVFVGVDSTWRWRSIVGDRYFYRFWSQALRFLSTTRMLGETKRFAVSTDKNTYTVGESVMVRARVFRSESFSVDREAAIKAFARRTDEEPFEISLRPIPGSDGLFEGTFLTSEKGTHELWLEQADGKRSALRTFAVNMPAVEFAETAMNEAELRKVAEMSGGAYFSIAEIGRIPDAIRKEQKMVVTAVAQSELGDSPLLLLLFCSFIILEWILRKRKTMV